MTTTIGEAHSFSSHETAKPEVQVAIVVPAKNAQATLARTLRSLSAQSHRNLEIIVVDDGSSDDTPAIVGAHAATDARVRLVSLPKSLGVGAARNRGAAATDAPYLAFCDADDLMTVDAISARLTRLRADGAGMAYGWTAIIDEHDLVRKVRDRATFHGDVFERLLRGNFIGNGSAGLCTREAFQAAGGFAEAGVDGCQDYKFYLDVAEQFSVSCVPRVLIGYREYPGTMSSDPESMLSGLAQLHLLLIERRPDLKPTLARAADRFRLFYSLRLVRSGRLSRGIRNLLRIGPRLPLLLLWNLKRHLAVRWTISGLPEIDAPFPYGDGAAANRE